MQSLVQKNLEMKKLTSEYQMMLMAEQTCKMSFKLSTSIRNDGTIRNDGFAEVSHILLKLKCCFSCNNVL